MRLDFKASFPQINDLRAAGDCCRSKEAGAVSREDKRRQYSEASSLLVSFAFCRLPWIHLDICCRRMLACNRCSIRMHHFDFLSDIVVGAAATLASRLRLCGSAGNFIRRAMMLISDARFDVDQFVNLSTLCAEIACERM